MNILWINTGSKSKEREWLEGILSWWSGNGVVGVSFCVQIHRCIEIDTYIQVHTHIYTSTHIHGQHVHTFLILSTPRAYKQ